ncbi:MAG: hypothetical protein ACP5JO_04150 [Candidatus Ratteibacteria bacterium]
MRTDNRKEELKRHRDGIEDAAECVSPGKIQKDQGVKVAQTVIGLQEPAELNQMNIPFPPIMMRTIYTSLPMM